MKIRILETGEIEELSLIDPKSGVDWIRDLMGNHDAVPLIDEKTDEYCMDQENFDWWDNLITSYQVADNRYHGLKQSLDGEAYNRLVEEYETIDVDLEDFPTVLDEVCDQFDN